MYYSVYRGYSPGIYSTWAECKKNVNGFKGALFKKFEDYSDATEYLMNGPKKIVEKIKMEKEVINLDDYTKLFTDGSLLRKNNFIACGYGIYIPSLNISYSRKLADPKTNNRAELKAIIDGIKILKNDNKNKIVIYTDSSYSILIFGETGKKYQKKNYKNVKNKDLVIEAVTLSEKTNLHFIHVSAHTGNKDTIAEGNDIADKLANKAAVDDYILVDKNWKDREYSVGKYNKIKLCDIPRDYLNKFINSDGVENMCKKNEHIRTIKHIVLNYIKQ